MKRSLILMTVAAGLWASSPTAWEMNTYQDFLKGRFENVSLTRDGSLRLAPALDTFFSSDQPAVWALAAAPDGAVYAGTGHHGRVFRIDAKGKSEIVFSAEQPEVFALAVDSKGVLFAGTSPDGKVYRIEKGRAAEYFAPGTKYIWALKLATDGARFVGTGDQGKVFRVTGAGQGEVYYETGQNHVTALAFDAAGRLLAGTEPNGVLYRIERKDKAFVLLDANLPKIRGIVTAPDGTVLVAALGGGMGARAGFAQRRPAAGTSGAAVTATSTSITVEAAAQGGPEIKPKADAPKPAAAAPRPAPPVPAPIVDLSGLEKSAIYRIAADHTVETLWSSKEENIYDVALKGSEILFSTDFQGRLWRLTPDRKAALVAQTNAGETARVLEAMGGWLAASASAGKIFRLRGETAAAGVFESPVHDAGSVARWGKLTWRNGSAKGLVFRTRSGNSARPDKTWSEWSEPLADGGGAQVASPNARYIQWKAEFADAAASLDSVSLAYLTQNNPPVVKNLTATLQWAGPAQARPAAAAQAAAPYSITVTDSAEMGAATAAGTPTQLAARASGQQLAIAWQAEDPDGDRLVYRLQFRGEGEQEWKTLKANLTELSLTLDGDSLADGKYLFRVTASDRPVNPPGQAREGELVSAPVLIDNTPPALTVGAPRRSGGAVEIDVEAADAASPVRRAEFAVDGGEWTPVEAQDGVADSRRERFAVRVVGLVAGEHLVVIRVYDAAGNAGLSKVVLAR
jgi:hypothetical protein